MIRKADWVFYCDICGRRCYSSEATRLPTYSGRGGLIVCKHDVDKTDPGLIPYRIPVEKSVPWMRINHTDTTDGSTDVDLEDMVYLYYLAASQDSAVLMASQDDAWLLATEPL